jgi:hypothetical protein
MLAELATTIIVTVAGTTGIWSGPYTPPPEPEPVAAVVTTTQPAATVVAVPVAEPEPCLTVYAEWVDEYTAVVAGYDGPGGDDGFLFDFKGHVLNYQWQGGAMQSVELAAGQAAVAVCR